MSAGETANWDETLGSAGRVRFMKGTGGLPMLSINTEWSSAEIYLHGAHVTRFQKKNEPPLLFLSQASQFVEEKPIRGGIPIILPWFGAREGQSAHGFARTKIWELVEVLAVADGTITAHLRLSQDNGVTGFPPFTADYVVTVRDTLALRLVITNQSTDQDLTFEECLHTYFEVGDVNAVSVVGLKGVSYLDKVGNVAEKIETADAIKIFSEVDRVYLDTTGAVEIQDASLHRKIRVEKENSASTVVWNPWIAKAHQMPDFGDQEYFKMVCVESGNVGKNKSTLAPGKSSVLSVKLSTANW
jgi:glucose-6-phosphate 1-epimerase